MGVRKKSFGQSSLERENRLVRLEKLVLRGITNQTELSAAFGVTVATIHSDIKKIRERWARGACHDGDGERNLRVHQLDNIAALALNSFDRSRQDIEEFSLTQRRCLNCAGTGQEEVTPGEFRKCLECAGTGKLTIEVTRVKGQAGEAGFLRVAKECFVEAAKIRGAYPGSVSFKALQTEAAAVGGVVQKRVEALFIEAPVDLIIKAKAALDDLRESVDAGESHIIDVEAAPSNGGSDEEESG